MHTEIDPRSQPLFRPDAHEPTKKVSFRFEDHQLSAPAGVSVAAALLLNGVDTFRTTAVSASPRAPYCMMGVCFDCVVEIDGVPSRQSCLTAVRDGMKICRQRGATDLGQTEQGDSDGR